MGQPPQTWASSLFCPELSDLTWVSRLSPKLARVKLARHQMRSRFKMCQCKKHPNLYRKYFIVDSITDVPFTSPLPSSTQSSLLLPSCHYHTVVCVYKLFTHALRLAPSPSFIHSPLPTPFWQLSVCSMCPCLWSYFVCQVFLFIRFHIWVRLYGICLALTCLFHWA